MCAHMRACVNLNFSEHQFGISSLDFLKKIKFSKRITIKIN